MIVAGQMAEISIWGMPGNAITKKINNNNQNSFAWHALRIYSNYEKDFILQNEQNNSTFDFIDFCG